MSANVNWKGRAHSRWGRAAVDIQGDGPIAVLAHCPPGLTVYLFTTIEEAEARKAFIDKMACGGGCWRTGDNHQIVDMRIRQRINRPLYAR